MNSRQLLAAALAGLLVVAAAGCGEPGALPVGAAAPTPEPDRNSTAIRYRAVGTVVENREHGPRLCHNIQIAVSPPNCGELDVIGWSWDGLTFRDEGGTRHGTFALVGTYDGQRFTLTEPPRTPGPPAAAARETSACAPPPGGWRVVDDAKATRAALVRAMALADSAYGAGGAWVDESDQRGPVLNVRTTGDVAEHERRLRAVWGGALCVTRAGRTRAELDRVQDEVLRLPGVFSTSIDRRANQVRAEVWAATDDLRRTLDARFGPGAVALIPFLEPV